MTAPGAPTAVGRVGPVGIIAVSVTERGRILARRLPWEHVHGQAAETIRARWDKAGGFVLFLAAGAAVRIIAPLLADKTTDPAVVCVDEAGRYVVALSGGHAGGANHLARAVAARLGAEAVITTASDAMDLVALDQLPGFVAEGDIAAVTTALLDGRPVTIDNPRRWPLPYPAGAGGSCRIVVSDLVVEPGPGTVVLHPPSLVVGVGAASGAPASELAELVGSALADAGLARASVSEVATIDRRAGDPAVVALGWTVRSFAAAALAGVEVPNPSPAVQEAVGSPSVCEAAALLTAGDGGELVVTKRRGPATTVAIARRGGPRGHLSIVGLGPGGPGHRTAAAEAAVRRADLVIGYQPYLEQCADLARPGQERVASPIGDETVRAKQALAEASAGRHVALVSSGDAGVYGMASICLELADGTVDIDVVPGVTAALAASAVLGAPLGHDHAAVSLSDLLTPWPVIERRLRAAASADMVISLYNPRSRGRPWQLDAARTVLLEHRAADTPVGVVTAAGRPDQHVILTTLGRLEPAGVGMTSCVVVGSSTTRVAEGRMVTPRGYRP
jgi:cobalt-precorrin 5A hydrolase/precorrin-3B C17-methyltransferase